jgi:hypothetical protein
VGHPSLCVAMGTSTGLSAAINGHGKLIIIDHPRGGDMNPVTDSRDGSPLYGGERTEPATLRGLEEGWDLWLRETSAPFSAVMARPIVTQSSLMSDPAWPCTFFGWSLHHDFH